MPRKSAIHRPTSLYIAALVAVFAFGFCTTVSAAPSTKTPSKRTGSSFRKQLKLPIGLSWKDVPLRQALNTLADDQRVTIYLDRRVDPGQKISVTIAGQPLATALEDIARQQQLGVCLIGDMVYFGQPKDVDRLRTTLALRRQEASRFPADARNKLLAKVAMTWKDLATPAELLKQLAASGVRIYGEQNLPHDLWPAHKLPQLTWVDRLGIIVGQFDHTLKFSPDGTAVALIPIPESLHIDATAGKLPKVSPKTTPGSKQVYTLKIENQPIGKLLTALGKQLGVELSIDKDAIERAGRSLDILVSFEVRGVELEALLRAATKPAGLSFRQNGTQVTIVPAP
jgi:hypothetical protein